MVLCFYQLVLSLLYFMILLMYPLVASELNHSYQIRNTFIHNGTEMEFNVAKSGCQSRCKNVKIPYPFGIGENCSLDEWFNIDCNSTGAFLTRIHMEVLNIDYINHIVSVHSPIISSNCPNRKPGELVDLRQSPFAFSNTMNSFIALGCNNRALLTYNGYMQKYDKSFDGYEPCLGQDCCQNAIPRQLQVFNVSFPRYNVEEDKRCKLAFIAEDKWMSSKVEDPNTKIRDMNYVPAILEWSISSAKKNLFNRNEKTTEIYLVCKNGYDGNPYLPNGCQDVDECRDPRLLSRCHGICLNTRGSYKCQKYSNNWILVLSLTIGTWLLCIVVRWLLIYIKTRKNKKLKEKFFKRNGGLLLNQQLCSCQGNVDKIKIFTSTDLEKATDNFNVNGILGQGGQGTVYKGMLADGRIVAVKKSKIIDGGAQVLEKFINEVVILSQINHRNVVRLLGCCLETEVPLLVYEFICNGTLHHYLHDRSEEFLLPWYMRLRIATEVSRALSYLHSAASMSIFHRDVKSANILLDEKYTAKVSDFGTSRSIATDQTHLSTDQVHGTFGYMDPEYFQSSKFTEKSDVYSFGVVLVELLTGQKPVSSTESHGGIGLAAYFIFCLENGNLLDLIDPRIREHCVKEEVIVVADLAKRCLNLNGKKRPSMNEVTLELEGIQISQKKLNASQNSEKSESKLQDVGSISRHSVSDSGRASSIDIESLMYTKTW